MTVPEPQSLTAADVGRVAASPTTRWWLVVALLLGFALADHLVLDPEQDPAWVRRWHNRLTDLAALPARMPPGWQAVDRSKPLDLSTRLTRFFSVTSQPAESTALVSIGYVHDPVACYQDAGYTVRDPALVRIGGQMVSRFVRIRGTEEAWVWHWFIDLETLTEVGTTDLHDRLIRIGHALKRGRALELLHVKILLDAAETAPAAPALEARLIPALTQAIARCAPSGP